jgi:hypothetical protein
MKKNVLDPKSPEFRDLVASITTTKLNLPPINSNPIPVDIESNNKVVAITLQRNLHISKEKESKELSPLQANIPETIQKIIPKTECIKVSSLRKTYKEDINLEKWMAMSNNLYTGRRGRIFIGGGDNKRIFHYPDSLWKNPYKIPEYSLETSLKLYEAHVRENLMEHIHELEGKTLGCFCNQKNPCHTQILVKLFKEKMTRH